MVCRKMPFGITPTDFLSDLQYLYEVLNPTNHFQEELRRLNWVLLINNITLLQLFEIASPPCEDFILICRYENEIKPCADYLKRSLTPYGLCCSFNYAYINGERRYVIIYIETHKKQQN